MELAAITRSRKEANNCMARAGLRVPCQDTWCHLGEACRVINIGSFQPNSSTQVE